MAIANGALMLMLMMEREEISLHLLAPHRIAPHHHQRWHPATRSKSVSMINKQFISI
jgi:hypothetical protein